MGKKSDKPLSLVESSQFESSKKKISSSAKRLDDALWGVTFAIAREPEEFSKDKKTDIQIAKTRKTEDMPALTIYFRVEGEKARLLEIELTNSDSEE